MPVRAHGGGAKSLASGRDGPSGEEMGLRPSPQRALARPSHHPTVCVQALPRREAVARRRAARHCPRCRWGPALGVEPSPSVIPDHELGDGSHHHDSKKENQARGQCACCCRCRRCSWLRRGGRRAVRGRGARLGMHADGSRARASLVAGPAHGAGGADPVAVHLAPLFAVQPRAQVERQPAQRTSPLTTATARSRVRSLSQAAQGLSRAAVSVGVARASRAASSQLVIGRV